MSRLDDARALAGRIRAVNPTHDPSVLPDGAPHRYAMKAAWQSRLLRDFWDLVTIDPEPDQPGLVRLAVQGSSACHAVVSELDVDVRGRVWHTVDTAAGISDPSDHALAPEAARQTSTAEQARKAIAAYDLTTASELLAPAFDSDPADVGVARAWLELLVMHLADDASAVASGARLRGAAVSDPRCRALVALAAGRVGQPALALSWARDARASDLPPVMSIIGVMYAARGDADAARRCRLRLDDLPADPGSVRRLDDALDALRSRELADAEAELTRFEADEAETLDDVERAARRVLNRFPDSLIARDLLATVAEQRVGPLWLEANAARESGDEEGLLRALEALARAGEEQVQPLIADLRASRAPRRQRERAELLARQLGSPPKRSKALRNLAMADDEVRRLVAALLPSDRPVHWLLSLRRARAAKAARGLVASVQALTQALDRGAADDLDGARRHLKSVSGALRRHPDAEALSERLDRAAEAARKAASEAGLEQAAAALGRRDATAAGEALRRVSDPEYQDARAALQAAVDDLSATLKLEAQARDSKDLTLARWATQQLLISARDEERDHWSTHAADLRALLRRQLDATLSDDEAAIALAAVPPGRPRFQHRPLLEDGTLVIATAVGQRLLVRTPRKAVSLALPMEPTRCDIAAFAGRLWVHGKPGYALELDPESLEPITFIDLRRFAGRLLAHGTLVAPDGRHIWVIKLDADHGAAFIVDGDRGTPATNRMLNDVRSATTHADGVIALRWGGRLVWTSADGTVRAESPAPPRGTQGLTSSYSLALARTDPGPSAWILHRARTPEGYAEVLPVVLSELDPATGIWHRRFTVPGSDAGRDAVAAGDDSALYVRYHDVTYGRRLAAFARTTEGVCPEPTWDVPLRPGDDIIQGQLVDRAVPLRHEPGAGPPCSRLSPDTPPPSVPTDDDELARACMGYRLCEGYAPGRHPQMTAAMRRLGRDSPGRRRRSMAGFAERVEPERYNFAVAVYALMALDDPDSAEALVEGALTRCPHAAWPHFLRADIAAFRDDWDRVRTSLQDLEALAGDAPGARHAHHLAALERLRAGDRQAARRLATRGGSLAGNCDLDIIVSACDAADAADAGAPADPDGPRVLWHCAAIRDAQAASTSGDQAAARDLLAQPALFAYAELTALSRLIEALPEEPGGWLEHVACHLYLWVLDVTLSGPIDALPPALVAGADEAALRELGRKAERLVGSSAS